MGWGVNGANQETMGRVAACSVDDITVPRSLAPFFQPVTAATLHAFGDASKLGVSAAADTSARTRSCSYGEESRNECRACDRYRKGRGSPLLE